MSDSVFRKKWMVKPSECNANRELPLTLLASQMIDLATDHANQIGIGFINIESKGQGWVLSRLSVEMKRWPGNGESYILSTWIESYNSHFSERCFSVESPDGEILGYGRTIWVIINLATHQSLGTGGTTVPEEFIPGISCPIPKMTRHRSFVPDRSVEYTFQYTDLDFYRHVNTVKYIALLLNQFTLQQFDSYFISRFDIAFAHEGKYGETAVINYMDSSCETPLLLGRDKASSHQRIFELQIKEQTILNASIILTGID